MRRCERPDAFLDVLQKAHDQQEVKSSKFTQRWVYYAPRPSGYFFGMSAADAGRLSVSVLAAVGRGPHKSLESLFYSQIPFPGRSRHIRNKTHRHDWLHVGAGRDRLGLSASRTYPLRNTVDAPEGSRRPSYLNSSSMKISMSASLPQCDYPTNPASVLLESNSTGRLSMLSASFEICRLDMLKNDIRVTCTKY